MKLGKNIDLGSWIFLVHIVTLEKSQAGAFVTSTPPTTQPQYCSWVGHENDCAYPTTTTPQHKLNRSLQDNIH